MNIAAPFIRRPVATTLLTLGLTLAGIAAFLQLPVAPLPQVEFPTIAVQAALPGASPEVMAATVATPLERSLARIAGVTEMTSSSSLGATRITLQFDLNRDIDGASRDVQAAINAARSLLPTGLPSNPSYRKVNPADAPIMILGLTSDTLSRGQLYDAASTLLAQRLAQIDGIGQVTVGGSSLPAVRVELNPNVLGKYGIGLEDVRTAIVSTNANRPKGAVEDGNKHWQLYANDQATVAADYLPLIVAYRKGAPVRISDLGEVVDSVEDLRNAGLSNGKPSVLLILNKQPGANIIDTVARVQDLLPALRASISAAADLTVVMDRTPTIRSSLHDVERSLVLAVGLVILVVLVFLRDLRAILIPSIAVSVSLIATFGVMHLCSYSLDTLSLMALTIATGFVVDDAIVVLENTQRHIEEGVTPYHAALRGAGEVAFTVLSMSLSLIAVFIPILLMGGIVGRLFREFAVTLSAAVAVSLLVSLTTTPMLCARWLKPADKTRYGRLYRWSESAYTTCLHYYERSLTWALNHGAWLMLLMLATVGLNVYLYAIVPKGFFPVQDVGRVVGTLQADQSISFAAMQQKLADFVEIVRKDPAVENVVGFAGGQQLSNTGLLFAVLKPLAERRSTTDEVLGRMRNSFTKVPGARLFLQPVQDLRVGGRGSAAMFQYTLQADHLADLRTWVPRIVEALAHEPTLVDVNTDQQDHGQQTSLHIDRDTATRLGLTPAIIDASLNDAFGQRQVSVIYNPLNQYHVVLELAPQYWQSPEALQQLYLRAPPSPRYPLGVQVPLAALASHAPENAPLAVNHQGQFTAATISFNLKPGASLSDATRTIADTLTRLGVPGTVHGSFQGTAKVFQSSLDSQPWLVLAALVTIYIVLGVLYESYVHPLTILSTLPSAGVGALLALLILHTEFSIIALIGVILLIGIVKKNAIMMIDFAVVAERSGLDPRTAIYQACILRFRPIMMTTLAALLGALPLALGMGEGAEMRTPLGIAVVGGLLVSQMLTLYTTPIVYLYLDRFRLWCHRLLRQRVLEAPL
jgi:multidrug efflux pump